MQVDANSRRFSRFMGMKKIFGDTFIYGCFELFGIYAQHELVSVHKVANFLKTWRVWFRMFEFDVS